MSSSDAVEYLVLRMFPAKLVNQTRVGVGDGKSRKDAEAYMEKVEIYERALRGLSNESLTALVKDERQQDAALLREREEQLDRHRFFNDPETAADFSLWTRQPCWSLDEATALILGKNPQVVDWAHIAPLVDVSPFAARFAAIRRHLTHARENGQLFDPVSPAHFLAWARERGVVLPEELEGRIEERRKQTFYVSEFGADPDEEIVDGDPASDRAARPVPTGEALSDTVICFSREQSRLRAMGERMKAANEEPAREEEPAGREEEPAGSGPETLLKMLIAMAIGRYGFDPQRGRESTISDIVRDLERIGLVLSRAAVGNWLNEASACLPDRVRKDGEADRAG